MIIVNNIELQNFKNISSAELELNRFNILIGPNNSGKSNFLKLFIFLNKFITGSNQWAKKTLEIGMIDLDVGRIPLTGNHYDISDLKRRDTHSTVMFKLSFTDTSLNNIYEYTLEFKPTDQQVFDSGYFVSSEVFRYKNIGATGPLKRIFERTENSVTFGTELRKTKAIENVTDYSSVIKVLQIILEPTDERESYYQGLESLIKLLSTEIYYFSHGELRKDVSERTEKDYGRIIAYDLEAQIAKLHDAADLWESYESALRSILDINKVAVYKFEGLDINSDEEVFISFEHLGKPKGLSQFSEGSLLLLALITRLYTSKSSLFIIEEPENSIHPKALAKLIEFLRSLTNEKQIIITTHSIPILNSVAIDEIIISKVDGKGESRLQKVSDDTELVAQLKKGRYSFSDYLFLRKTDEQIREVD